MVSYVAGEAAVLCRRLEFPDVGGLGPAEVVIRPEEKRHDGGLRMAYEALLADGVRNMLKP